jgi:hypothetical protein
MLIAAIAWPRSSAPPPLERATEGRGTLTGRVPLDPASHRDATVFATRDGVRERFHAAAVGPDGTFRFDDLVADDYQVVAVVPRGDVDCVYTLDASVRDGSYTLVDASGSLQHCGNCGFMCAVGDPSKCSWGCE